MSSSQLLLAPEILNRLHKLQQANRPVSVDEILHAANLNHLALPMQQPTQSKSAEIPSMTRRQPDSDCQKVNATAPLRLEKSVSTLTLAERRRILVSPKKLTLDGKSLSSSSSSSSAVHQTQGMPGLQKEHLTSSAIKSIIDTTTSSDFEVDRYEQLDKLEIENAKTSPQVSVEYLLSHLKRQNATLQSESIEPNHLKSDFDTIRHQIDNNNNNANISQVTPLPSGQINQINTSLLLESTASDGTLDWDLWQYLVDDYPTAAAKLPHLVSARLRNGGVPYPLRGVLWQAMARSSSPRLETMYESLVNGTYGFSSSYAQVIQRDLSHIFATVKIFSGDNDQIQQALERLLTSYSIYDAQVGYCQGLVYLAGPLVMMMPEKQAFCVFVRLMETHEMRTMFILNKQGLHLRLYQFQTFLSQVSPRLDAHLTRHSIYPAMYAGQWYLTLFASSLPLHMVVKIYDLAFAEGAPETITRVAISMMQKNEKVLLDMENFEQIMMHLTSKEFYETAYDLDAGAVISDMTLFYSLTKIKMDNIAATYGQGMEQEIVRARQDLSIGFGGWKTNDTSSNSNSEISKSTTTAQSKRDSWFPWKVSKNVATITSTLDQSPTTPMIPLLTLSPTTTTASQNHNADGMEPMICYQTEGLVATLSQLQKDHSRLTHQVKAMKLDAMDYTAANSKLAERNSVLTRQLDKYNQDHHQLPYGGQPFGSTSFNLPPLSSTSCLADTTLSSLLDKANASRLHVLEKDQEFCSFVTTLRSTGDFGTLIAAALSTSTTNDVATTADIGTFLGQNEDEDDDTIDLPRSAIEIEDATAITKTAINHGVDAISNLDTATQELLAVKLANFEMGQKYEDICHENETLANQLTLSEDKEQMYLDQMAVLEKVRADQAQEIDTIISSNERLSERIMAIKQTSAELHMEKLTLMDQVSHLERDVSELKREKQEYLMPRDSFSEEVFAAHHTLFGEGSVFQQHQQQQQQQDHGTKLENNNNSIDYQRKYVDSELRCRELEKLLAETKVKLVDYETTPAPTQKRPTSFAAIKGNGNSNIHGLMLTTKGAGIVGSAAMTRDDSAATRASIDSMSTTTSSKRSSVYSRLWNSITTPITPSSVDALPFSISNNNDNSKLEDRYQPPTIVHSEFTPI